MLLTPASRPNRRCQCGKDGDGDCNAREASARLLTPGAAGNTAGGREASAKRGAGARPPRGAERRGAMERSPRKYLHHSIVGCLSMRAGTQVVMEAMVQCTIICIPSGTSNVIGLWRRETVLSRLEARMACLSHASWFRTSKQLVIKPGAMWLKLGEFCQNNQR